MKQLLNKINATYRFIPTTQAIGYGQLANATVDAFDNVDNMNMAHTNYHVLQTAVGEYKRQVLESINPIYWIETIIFLPRKIVRYFGGNEKGIIAWILNFLYWMSGIIVSIYSSDIRQLLNLN